VILKNVRDTLDAATLALFEARSSEERTFIGEWLLSAATALSYVINEGEQAKELLVEVQIVAESLA